MALAPPSPDTHPDAFAAGGEPFALPPLILNREDPNSIHHMVPEWLSEMIDKIPYEMQGMDPKKLKDLCKPSYIVEAIRGAFWAEYNRCAYSQCDDRGQVRMVLTRIYSGICSEIFFERTVCSTPRILSWVLCPPQNYLRSLEATLRLTQMRLYEIADEPLTDAKSKKFDHKKAQLVMKIHEMLDARIHGTPTNKSITAHVNVPAPLPSPDNLDNIERRIDMQIEQAKQALRKEKREVIDVEGADVTGGVSGESSEAEEEGDRASST